jgi:hypothetical protein
MKQQASKLITDQRLSSSNKRQPPTKLGAEPSNHLQKVLMGNQEYEMLSAEQFRNRKPASQCSHIYAKSVQNDPFSTFQLKSRRNSGKVIHPQWHYSPRHLTTILSNDPQYGSILTGDQVLLSIILQILIKAVSEGSWSNRSDLPYDQLFFNSRNKDASRLSLGGAMLLSTGSH